MTKHNKRHIPEFKNAQEEADFWDTHDFTDYLDEVRPAKVRFAKKLSTGITVRFDEQTLTELRSTAKDKGMGPTTLVRMWVLERLQRTSSHKQQPEL